MSNNQALSKKKTNHSIERRGEKRKKIDTQVNFFIDADFTKAKTVDVSGSGICFETEEPICMHLRMEINGTVFEHVADLVWCQRNESGGMTYGLEFHKD